MVRKMKTFGIFYRNIYHCTISTLQAKEYKTELCCDDAIAKVTIFVQHVQSVCAKSDRRSQYGSKL